MTDLLTITPALPVLPEIQDIQAYKSVYALCSVDRFGQLKATHYAAVLIGGPSPIWGIWTVQGKLIRFLGSRAKIEEAYPRLVWRRKMASWRCTDLTDKSVATRRAELESHYGKPTPHAPLALGAKPARNGAVLSGKRAI
jgi:hypothetical protein